jgi:hypothetical protein
MFLIAQAHDAQDGRHGALPTGENGTREQDLRVSPNAGGTLRREHGQKFDILGVQGKPRLKISWRNSLASLPCNSRSING